MNLLKSDLDIIRHTGYPKKINLSIGDYYVKMVNDKFSAINELIGHNVAATFGLICPNYYLVNVDGEQFILSSDLNLLGDFITADALGLENEFNSLPDILQFLIAKYGDKKDIICDVVKIYIMDLLLSNPDRTPSNWGIIKLANGNMRVCIFDHEYLFNKWQRPNKIYFKDQNLENKYDDLKFFLKEANTEFVDMFYYYFNLMSTSYFQDFLKEFALDNRVLPTDLEQIFEIYQKNYQEINNVIRGIEYGRK